jgi:hypothetical protein
MILVDLEVLNRSPVLEGLPQDMALNLLRWQWSVGEGGDGRSDNPYVGRRCGHHR